MGADLIAPIMLHVARTVGRDPSAATTAALWICFGSPAAVPWSVSASADGRPVHTAAAPATRRLWWLDPRRSVTASRIRPPGRLRFYDKYADWTYSACEPERLLTKDEMLDDLSLSWFTIAATSSARLHWREQRNNRKRGQYPIGAGSFVLVGPALIRACS
jgi:hypothetical protein